MCVIAKELDIPDADEKSIADGQFVRAFCFVGKSSDVKGDGNESSRQESGRYASAIINLRPT